jgi:serine/threonine protein kinase
VIVAQDRAYVFREQQYRLPVLLGGNCALWFYIIQIGDVDGIDERVLEYVTRHPELTEAKDEQGRLAKDVATPSNKAVMRSISLVHGRYRVIARTPLHMSATCFVYEGTDELHVDEEGHEAPIKVVLKLMKNADQFLQEIQAREEAGFDASHVVNILDHHIGCSDRTDMASTSPSAVFDELSNVPHELFTEATNAASNGLPLTRTLAEQFHILVLPFGERNMYVALKQERFAGRDMGAVAHIFGSIVRCVEGMHSKGFIHGDIKPLNLVRIDGAWKLIDLDASVRIGDKALGKYSSAYVPPEALVRIGISVDDQNHEVDGVFNMSVRIKAPDTTEALVADPSFDVWSLGCLLYQLCHPHVLPLFQAGQDDNLDTEADLIALHDWTDRYKQAQLAKITHPMARNLLALMLTRKPLERPTLSRVLAHPFISGNAGVARLPGAEPEYDCFLSYRVDSEYTENKHVEQLYNLLVARGTRVWWDKACLPPGEPWEKHFFAGMVKSRTFVCLLSKHAINHPDKPWQNLSQLTIESRCDNVYLEHRAALELRSLGYIERVFPVLIGDRDPTTGEYGDLLVFGSGGLPNAPECHVSTVEEKLVEHMNAQALGTPLEADRTVKSVLGDILACQGAKIMGDGSSALEAAADKIADMLKEGDDLARAGADPEAPSDEVLLLLSKNMELSAALLDSEEALEAEKLARSLDIEAFALSEAARISAEEALAASEAARVSLAAEVAALRAGGLPPAFDHSS